MAVSKQLLLVKKKRTVPAGQTIVADSIPLTHFNCLDYFLCYKNPAANVLQTLKILAQKVDADVEESLYACMGNSLLTNEFVVVGANSELQITNNELFDVEVNFVRTKL